MSASQLVESKLDPEAAVVDEICPAGEPWVKLVMQGQVFRIVDLGGKSGGGYSVLQRCEGG